MLRHRYVLASLQDVAIKLVQGLIVIPRAALVVKVPSLANVNQVPLFLGDILHDAFDRAAILDRFPRRGIKMTTCIKRRNKGVSMGRIAIGRFL